MISFKKGNGHNIFILFAFHTFCPCALIKRFRSLFTNDYFAALVPVTTRKSSNESTTFLPRVLLLFQELFAFLNKAVSLFSTLRFTYEILIKLLILWDQWHANSEGIIWTDSRAKLRIAGEKFKTSQDPPSLSIVVSYPFCKLMNRVVIR